MVELPVQNKALMVVIDLDSIRPAQVCKDAAKGEFFRRALGDWLEEQARTSW